MTKREMWWAIFSFLCGLLVAAQLSRLGVTPDMIERGVMVVFVVITFLLLRRVIFYPPT